MTTADKIRELIAENGYDIKYAVCLIEDGFEKKEHRT